MLIVILSRPLKSPLIRTQLVTQLPIHSTHSIIHAQELTAILSYLPPASARQTLLFSATQTKSVKQLARLSLSDPEYVAVHERSDYATPKALEQLYITCPLDRKLDVLFYFIKTHLKSKACLGNDSSTASRQCPVFISSVPSTNPHAEKTFRRHRHPGLTSRTPIATGSRFPFDVQASQVRAFDLQQVAAWHSPHGAARENPAHEATGDLH